MSRPTRTGYGLLAMCPADWPRLAEHVHTLEPSPFTEDVVGTRRGTVDPCHQEVLHALVHVSASNRTGSGFLVRLQPELYVTNAHVVDGADQVMLTRGVSPLLEKADARVVAIDYPHDLALLEVDRATPFLALKALPLVLADCQGPGQDIYMAGHPFGLESPLLGCGIVAGTLSANSFVDWHMSVVAFCGHANPGSSGGPLYDRDGQVLGVVTAAKAPHLFCHPSDLGDESIRHFLESIQTMVAGSTGIGIAVPADRADHFVCCYENAVQDAYRTFRHYPAQAVSFPRDAYIELQRAALLHGAGQRDPDRTLLGIFSFDEYGQPYLGWSRSPHREPLDLPRAWSQLLRGLPAGQGSFRLLGPELHLYRPQYRGWTVPRKLVLF